MLSKVLFVAKGPIQSFKIVCWLTFHLLLRETTTSCGCGGQPWGGAGGCGLCAHLTQCRVWSRAWSPHLQKTRSRVGLQPTETLHTLLFFDDKIPLFTPKLDIGSINMSNFSFFRGSKSQGILNEGLKTGSI